MLKDLLFENIKLSKNTLVLRILDHPSKISFVHGAQFSKLCSV